MIDSVNDAIVMISIAPASSILGIIWTAVSAARDD
jgi:hypothetical protein